MKINRDQFYSTTAAAKLLQVSRGSVLRWIHEGHLKAGTTAGGHHRIQAQDLFELIKQLRIPVQAEVQASDESNTIKRVLIVEDDLDMCRLIQKRLRELSDKIVCEEAHDGLQAGWKLSQFIPDLVILDLHLPKIDGYEVCKFLKSKVDFQKTKIIAISTHALEKKDRIMKMGANYFLGKPFRWDDFEQAVRSQMVVV